MRRFIFTNVERFQDENIKGKIEEIKDALTVILTVILRKLVKPNTV